MAKSAGVLMVIFLGATGCSGSGLGGPGGCNEIGCRDGFSVTLRPQENRFPIGRHEVFLATAESRPAVYCSLDLPPGDGPSFPQGRCSGGASFSIVARVTCTTTSSGDSVSQSCTPIPGQFEAQLALPGTPAQVRIIVRLAGETTIDRMLAPNFAEVRPNGGSCPPVCRQSQQEWMFSTADRPTSAVACAPSECKNDDDCAGPGHLGPRCIQAPLEGPCVRTACQL